MGEDRRIIINGRASICRWSLEAAFLTKEQAASVVQKILALSVDFPVSYSVEYSAREDRDVHVVRIGEMSWANNLVAAAEILRESDWQEPDEAAAQRDMQEVGG
jgi:hypothetical protein